MSSFWCIAFSIIASSNKNGGNVMKAFEEVIGYDSIKSELNVIRVLTNI